MMSASRAVAARRALVPRPHPGLRFPAMNATPLPKQPLAVFASFWRHRTLIVNLAKRDVVGRYSGSVLGLLWSFFNPLLMLAVYAAPASFERCSGGIAMVLISTIALRANAA